MRRVQTKQTLKLQMLAFVLALALVWYSLNPISRPITPKKKEDGLPDEKKRNVAPRAIPVSLPVAFIPTGEAAEPLQSTDTDEDDFEWPEFIDG